MDPRPLNQAQTIAMCQQTVDRRRADVERAREEVDRRLADVERAREERDRALRFLECAEWSLGEASRTDVPFHDESDEEDQTEEYREWLKRQEANVRKRIEGSHSKGCEDEEGGLKKRKKDEDEDGDGDGDGDSGVSVGVEVFKRKKVKLEGNVVGFVAGANVREMAAAYANIDMLSELKSLVRVLIGQGWEMKVVNRPPDLEKEWCWIALDWAKRIPGLDKDLRNVATNKDYGPSIARQGNDARHRVGDAEWTGKGGKVAKSGQYNGFLLCPTFLG